MRCPYCGGMNSDRAPFCSRCGRDLTTAPPRSGMPQQRPVAPPMRPPSTPPSQPPRPAGKTASQPAPGTSASYPSSAITSSPSLAAPNASSMPNQGAAVDLSSLQFPPHTVAELRALEPGALEYSVLSEAEGDGKKKVVRVLFQRCSAIQQVATLYKVCKVYQAEKQCMTLIIQGVYRRDTPIYDYTNGQLTFDRGVRLGSQMINRYRIETGTGFDSDSIRIVLSE